MGFLKGLGLGKIGGGNNVTMVNTCNLQSKRAMPEKRKQGKKWRGSWKCYLCGEGGMKLHPVFSQSRLLFWPLKASLLTNDTKSGCLD